MKALLPSPLCRSGSSALVLLLFTALPAAGEPTPADLVNPFIGASAGIGRAGGLGKTIPGATAPFGMVQVNPNTQPEEPVRSGYVSTGYSHEHPYIEGFVFNQMSGVGNYGDMGNFLVTPATGELRVTNGRNASAGPGYRSKWVRGSEKATAGYYAVRLEDHDIFCEATAMPHSGMLRFTFPENERSRIQIDLSRRTSGTAERQSVKVVGRDAIEGWIECTPEGGGWGNGNGQVSYTLYYYAQFSRPFTNFGVWSATIPADQRRKKSDVESEAYDALVAKAEILKGARQKEGRHLGFFTEFPTAKGDQVMLRAGFSYTSIEAARRNLAAEDPAGSFDRLRENAKALWNRQLAKIRIDGGTPEQRIVFSTAMYHAALDPRVISDVGGTYPSADGTTRTSAAFRKRTVFSGWDVFRSEFPLLTIIDPTVVSDTINSLVDQAEGSGRRYFERWELFNAYTGCMIGNPAISVIADAYAKGIRNFDVNKAYQYARNTSEKFGTGRRGDAGGISLTLEYAYTEWCQAQLARALGKPGDAAIYLKRSRNYRNVFDPEKGWFRPKKDDGSWEPWPAEGRMKQGYGSVQCNPYQQGWFVPHDVAGLAELLGGREKALADLQNFFDRTPAGFPWNDYYNQSNEPVHHVPFLFNRLGRPWLTQKWSRKICEEAYHDGVEGIVGNDDVGQMSAWFILASCGFHPICPGDLRYEITSPLFDRAIIQVGGGKTFVVTARNNSPENRYIQSAKLNGKPWDRCWLMHPDIMAGGTLELEMGPAPNEKWGLEVAAAARR